MSSDSRVQWIEEVDARLLDDCAGQGRASHRLQVFCSGRWTGRKSSATLEKTGDGAY